MYTYECPLGNRSITFTGPDPFGRVSGWGDGDDLNIKVFIKASPPWSFDLILHSNDTVTKPAEAAGITVTITRLQREPLYL